MFSNYALHSLKEGNSRFTHCPAEPKGISIWGVEYGQKVFIDCEKYIFSFTVSDDRSLIAFSNPEVDHYDTITVFDSKHQSRLYVILPDPLGFFVCGMLRFTSDNNTPVPVCGFLHEKCTDEDSCYFFIPALNAFHLYNSHIISISLLF